MTSVNLMKNKLKLSIMIGAFFEKKQIYMCKKIFKAKNIDHLFLKREGRA